VKSIVLYCGAENILLVFKGNVSLETKKATYDKSADVTING